VIKAINGEGIPVLFEYNTKGNIAKVTNALGDTRSYDYNLSGKVTHITDFNGGAVQYKYNNVGEVEEIINQADGSTKFTYDIMRNITSMINPNGDTVYYEYDKFNRVIRTIDEEGNATTYDHDLNGNVTDIFSPNDTCTIIAYDELDRQKSIELPDGFLILFDYDQVGNLIKVIDSSSNITKYEYDSAGQLVKLIDPMRNETKLTYTALGKVESIVNAKGEKQTYSYYAGGKLKSITLPCGESESYEYNKNGNIVKITNILGDETSLKYDCLGRVAEVINPLGHSKKFGYDAIGNITQVTDESGNITQYKYSQLGDVIEVIDAAGHSTKYEYDNMNRLTKLEQYRLIDGAYAVSKDQNCQITTYERNKKGEVVAVTSPLGDIVKFNYDKVGNVISKLDEDGYETLYEYNLVNKLEKVSYADGKTVEFSYNALKQLIEMRDWLGTTKIERDARGRTKKITDSEGNEVGYAWDVVGRKEKLTYPDGKEVEYLYNDSGKLNIVKSGADTTRYIYDSMGRVEKRFLPDNTITEYEFNAIGAITSLTHSKDKNILDQFKYTYDPVGNITQIEKHRVGIESDNGLFQYTYDSLGRLTSAKNGNNSKKYVYDSLGNRITSLQNGVEMRYDFNARNQLIKAQGIGIVNEYSYDNRGNLTQVMENEKLTATYTFDATNMMTEAFSQGKGTAEYTYNGFRNRVKKLENMLSEATTDNMPDPCKEVRYVLDMTLPYDNLLMTKGMQENQRFVWGNTLLSADLSIDNDNNNANNANGNGGFGGFHYLQDHLGSPIRLVGGGDGNDASMAYDEFGVPEVQAGQKTQGYNNPFGFTGYQVDDVAGLYYAQARYYDPQALRMMSEDTHWHTGNMVFGDNVAKTPYGARLPNNEAIMARANLYAYCINQPMVFADKDGAAPRYERTGEGGSTVPRAVLPNTPSLPQNEADDTLYFILGDAILEAVAREIDKLLLGPYGVLLDVASIVDNVVGVGGGVTLVGLPSGMPIYGVRLQGNIVADPYGNIGLMLYGGHIISLPQFSTDVNVINMHNVKMIHDLGYVLGEENQSWMGGAFGGGAGGGIGDLGVDFIFAYDRIETPDGYKYIVEFTGTGLSYSPLNISFPFDVYATMGLTGVIVFPSSIDVLEALINVFIPFDPCDD